MSSASLPLKTVCDSQHAPKFIVPKQHVPKWQSERTTVLSFLLPAVHKNPTSVAMMGSAFSSLFLRPQSVYQELHVLSFPRGEYVHIPPQNSSFLLLSPIARLIVSILFWNHMVILWCSVLSAPDAQSNARSLQNMTSASFPPLLRFQKASPRMLWLILCARHI